MEVRPLIKQSHFEVIQQMIAANLIQNKDLSAQKNDGFLIANYTKDALKKFHKICPILLAIDTNEVIGYVIVGNEKSVGIDPIVDAMIKEGENQVEGTDLPIPNKHIFVIQVCVKKSYRKKGVFQKLYASLILKYKNTHDLILTEVVSHNYLSLRAHKRFGFKTLHLQNDASHPHFMLCLRI